MAKRIPVPRLALNDAYQSFDRAFAPRGDPPETRRAYAQSVSQLDAYLTERGLSHDIGDIDRADLEG